MAEGAGGHPGPSVAVAIASTGRPAILADTLRHLAGLRDRPDRVVLSLTDPSDLGGVGPTPFPLEVLVGHRGSCAQRNRALDRLKDAGVILFLDDDFLVADGYVAGLRRLFAAHPDVVLATGRLLADGIHGRGLDHRQGLDLLRGVPEAPLGPSPEDVYSAYGCNMAARGATLAATAERFDEALPLYGWLEDLDFSRRLAAHGRVVRDESLLGVHLGTKVGRSRGLPLGYSQVANPLYLVRKGTMERRRALRLAAGNLAANLGKSLWPEPAIDRRGRLRGNLTALADLLRGTISPARVLDL